MEIFSYLKSLFTELWINLCYYDACIISSILLIVIPFVLFGKECKFSDITIKLTIRLMIIFMMLMPKGFFSFVWKNILWNFRTLNCK